MLLEFLVVFGKAAVCSVALQTPTQKRQRRQVSDEGEEEVGAGPGGVPELWRWAGVGEWSGMGLSSCAPCFIPPQYFTPHQGSRAQHLHSLPAGAAPNPIGGVQGRVLAPRSGGAQRWGNHEEEGRE